MVDVIQWIVIAWLYFFGGAMALGLFIVTGAEPLFWRVVFWPICFPLNFFYGKEDDDDAR